MQAARLKCDDGAAHMLARATELAPTDSNALNHHANYMFWYWQKAPFTVHVISGNKAISCSADPTKHLHAGTHIRLGDQGGGNIDAIILDGLPQKTTQDRWILKLEDAHISHISFKRKEQSLRMRNMREVDHLASRAYHCFLPC